jgi:hypothetical protein
VLGTVRVRQAHNEVRGVRLVFGPPTSRAGLRTVALPAAVLKIVQASLVIHRIVFGAHTLASTDLFRRF